ncbi:MAG: septum formation initiator family protein [Clostridia bacterium]|nr:septum formation initiator family protein [Clostridia bacterium]MBR3715961.1 septum formation initiator family protein [Clostridia bacterium]
MKRGNFFVIMLFAFLIVASVFTIVGLQNKLNDLRADYEELEKMVVDYKDEVDELKHELESEIDDEYVARIARERLGYHMPGEKIFYFGGYGK